MLLARQFKATKKSVRCLHTTPPALLPRVTHRDVVGVPAPPELKKTGLLLDKTGDGEPDADVEDGTAGAHLYVEQQREALYYMRLIEHDMPKLVRWRKPFFPPTREAPLVIRTIDYGGEDHPATAKRSITAPVAQLPLNTAVAIENFKLLAGNRWHPTPPRDSGISDGEDGAEHGYIKISCDDFPQPGMNLKWASDTLDKLVEEAHNMDPELSRTPMDVRHIHAKVSKAIKRAYHGGQGGERPSIRDFPKEWLPLSPTAVESVP